MYVKLDYGTNGGRISTTFIYGINLRFIGTIIKPISNGIIIRKLGS